MYSDVQQSLIILILSVACVTYLWVILEHGKSEVNPLKLHNGAVSSMGNYFNVIKLESQQEFDKFIEDFKAGQSYWEDGKAESSSQESYGKGWSSYKEKSGAADDFFLDLKQEDVVKKLDPIVPSNNFHCTVSDKPVFVTIRSELNYKYLWMHGTEDYTMSATATLDTPLHLKTFQVCGLFV